MVQSNSIEAILFDMGGVFLPAFDHRLSAHITRIYRQADSSKVDFATYQEVVSSLISRLQTGLPESDFWGEFARMTNIAKPQDASDIIMGPYASIEGPDSNMMDLVKNLQMFGYPVGVVSNTIKSHSEVLREKGFYEPFSVVVNSCNVGSRKPDDRIWSIALGGLARLGVRCIEYDDEVPVRARNVLLIDDNPNFVEGFKSSVQGRGIVHQDYQRTMSELQDLGVKCKQSPRTNLFDATFL